MVRAAQAGHHRASCANAWAESLRATSAFARGRPIVLAAARAVGPRAEARHRRPDAHVSDRATARCAHGAFVREATAKRPAHDVVQAGAKGSHASRGSGCVARKSKKAAAKRVLSPRAADAPDARGALLDRRDAHALEEAAPRMVLERPRLTATSASVVGSQRLALDSAFRGVERARVAQRHRQIRRSSSSFGRPPANVAQALAMPKVARLTTARGHQRRQSSPAWLRRDCCTVHRRAEHALGHP